MNYGDFTVYTIFLPVISETVPIRMVYHGTLKLCRFVTCWPFSGKEGASSFMGNWYQNPNVQNRLELGVRNDLPVFKLLYNMYS